MSLTEEECVRALVAGGERADLALTTLYKLWARHAIAILRRDRLEPHACEDIVHDCFMRLRNLQGKAVEIRHPRAYLHTILDSARIDYLRRKPKEAQLPENDDGETDDVAEFPLTEMAEHDPHEREERGQCIKRAWSAFQTRFPDKARALWLAAVEGMEREQVAEAIGRTYGAAREFLSQARKAFGTVLNAMCREYVSA